MSFNTYSFLDLTGSFTHPSVGAYTLTGAGIGEMSIARTNDVSAMDTASDGHVMISKMASPSGMITIQVQQTSDLNTFLMKWYAYIVLAGTDEWASANILIRAPKMGISHSAVGVCPQKNADRPYKAQGERITWNLMSAEIVDIPI